MLTRCRRPWLPPFPLASCLGAADMLWVNTAELHWVKSLEHESWGPAKCYGHAIHHYSMVVLTHAICSLSDRIDLFQSVRH